MKLTAIVTEEQIVRAEQMGACAGAIAWLRDQPRTWKEVIARDSRWLLEYAHAELAQYPELFVECARKNPEYALKFAHAELAQHPELFAECERIVNETYGTI